MSSAQNEQPLGVPTTGMRGGLGRRLLTAFLVMTIGPLSVLSWYATRSGRRDVQRQVLSKLTAVATVTELQVEEWAESRVRALEILASAPDVHESCIALGQGAGDGEAARRELRDHLDAFLAVEPSFSAVSFLSREGRTLVSAGAPPHSADVGPQRTDLVGRQSVFRILSLAPQSEAGAVVTRPVESTGGRSVGGLVGWLALGGLEVVLESAGSSGEGGELYLVDAAGMTLPQGDFVRSAGVDVAMAGDEANGLHENGSGVRVIGVYRALPDLGLVLVAEQPTAEAFAAADRVAAAIVAAALVVALVTSVIAAVVTRQITDPVVRLTESALRLAEGNLEQRVDVGSRDEIGILASVFNRMVTELRSLYDGLEAKVAERTALLREANYLIQRRAVQLAATVEISRAVASILDAGELLYQVVHLVHDRFGCHYVGIYLPAEDGARAELEASTGGEPGVRTAKARQVIVGDRGAVSQAFLYREPVFEAWSKDRSEAELSTPHVRAEAALPLIVRDSVVGVLDILTASPETIDRDSLSILASVARQVAIALDNARVYRNERDARQRLKHAEEMRSQFLAHMSRELREPLTNIIGFCRLILNGLDGPISDQQRRDLRIVYANSQHLLGLIDDLLDVSQIEAGLMELHFEDLDLQAMIKSVLATANAMVRDQEVQLRRDVHELPLVKGDAKRIRQVLLKLLTNAAKFTDKGFITVRAWSNKHEVFVSVSDTGSGIPAEDQKRIFEHFEQGSTEHGGRPNGVGLGLALSKEFVEMHGGEIWVESEVGKGSTFTFALPLEAAAKRPASPEGRRASGGT